MPRIARLTDALRGRGKAVVYLGAAAALAGAGAGTAMAATTPATAARPAVLSPSSHHAATLPVTSRPSGSTAPTALTGHAAAPAVSHASQAPAAKPAAQASTPAATPASTSTSSGSTSQPAQPSQPTAPYEFYDSTTPSQIPAGQHEIATYANGAYAVSPSQVSGKQVLWVDTNGSDPSANVLDVEPGDATPAQAATWVQQRETAHPGQIAVVYTMMSDWGAAQQAISALPHSMQANVRWWIADPTGTPHIVPGATATQWYWGPSYDISSANGTL
jgi:hypothetical protein